MKKIRKKKFLVFYLLEHQVLGIQITNKKHVNRNRYLKSLNKRWCKGLNPPGKFVESFAKLFNERLLCFFKKIDPEESVLSVLQENKPDYVIICNLRNDGYMYFNPAITLSEFQNSSVP